MPWFLHQAAAAVHFAVFNATYALSRVLRALSIVVSVEGDKAPAVKVGDVILPEWAKASPVKIDGNERAMIKEEFIIAVVE